MSWKKCKCKNSTVSEYEAGDNFIRMRFSDGKLGFNPQKRYQWTEYGVGKETIDNLKRLVGSEGIDQYIRKHDMRHQVARTY